MASSQSYAHGASATPLLGATAMTNAGGAAGTPPEVACARTLSDEASLVADRIEAALERKPSAVFEVVTPAGVKAYEVIKVEWI